MLVAAPTNTERLHNQNPKGQRRAEDTDLGPAGCGSRDFSIWAAVRCSAPLLLAQMRRELCHDRVTKPIRMKHNQVKQKRAVCVAPKVPMLRSWGPDKKQQLFGRKLCASGILEAVASYPHPHLGGAFGGWRGAEQSACCHGVALFGLGKALPGPEAGGSPHPGSTSAPHRIRPVPHAGWGGREQLCSQGKCASAYVSFQRNES